ncbi:MAG: hypothetical protein K0R38_2886 [Polyangiaceae bacterium]|nr:hypothetical protein [Polyangiaceae bacterium]
MQPPTEPPGPPEAAVKVGLCGFTMAMAEYPRHFGLLEVQQSFYEPPAERVAQRWRDAMPPDFEFTVKAWQLITHESKSPTYRRLKRTLSERERADCGRFRDTPIVREAMSRTLAIVRTLRASTVLFQCPASFGPEAENVQNLRDFITNVARPQCPPELRLAWEPRGPAWSTQAALALRVCEELQLIYVVDPFVDAVHVTSAGPAYLRLHGIGGARHVYTDEQLKTLAEKVPSGASVLFNNLPRVGDARRFQELMKRR